MIRKKGSVNVDGDNPTVDVNQTGTAGTALVLIEKKDAVVEKAKSAEKKDVVEEACKIMTAAEAWADILNDHSVAGEMVEIKVDTEEEKKKKAEEERAAKERQEKMHQTLIAMTVDHFVKTPDEFKKPLNIVMQKSGLFEVRLNKIGRFVTKVTEAHGAEDKLKEGFEYSLPRKIPISILEHTIKFFRLVNDEYKTEAYMQYYWDQENNRFLVHYPKQRCTAGHVAYDRDPELEKKYLLIVDIHSHNTMGASFSSVDDSDEKEARIFGVIGRIDQKIPEMRFRVSSRGKHVPIAPSQVFDLLTDNEELKELATEVEKLTPNSVYTAGSTTYNARSGAYLFDDDYTSYGGYAYSDARTYDYNSNYRKDPITKKDILKSINANQVGVIADASDVNEVFKEVISKYPNESIAKLIGLLVDNGFVNVIEHVVKQKFSGAEDGANGEVDVVEFSEEDFADAEGSNEAWK